MRRRYVLALVLAIALIFALLAGTAVGHYIVPRPKDDSATCRWFGAKLDRDFTGNYTSEQEANVLNYYDQNCR